MAKKVWGGVSDTQKLTWGAVPIGTIINFMGTIAPDGYLFCDGTEYNIADYAALAEFFEDQFGTKNHFGGDGITTFKVPDLCGEFLRCAGTNNHLNQGSGENVGVHQDNGLPNITADPFLTSWNKSTGLYGLATYGAFVKAANHTVGRITAEDTNGGHAAGAYTFGFDASQSNAIYGSSDYVTPTNTSVLCCIKY